MLSSMTTQNGLTIFGPDGSPLRLPASSPVYRAGKALLQQELTGEQTWKELLDLVANPLKSMASWGERFGVTIREDGDTLFLNDIKLSREAWLPLLCRLEATSGTPKVAMKLASQLGTTAYAAAVRDACLHHPDGPGSKLYFLRLDRLPAGIKPGDRVIEPGTAGEWFMVSYASAAVSDTGALVLADGVVVQQVDSGVDALDTAQDVLQQPCVVGLDRTYRCEYGNASGWFPDFAFDSLKKARQNASELHAQGEEVRIINRVSNELVSFT